MYVQSGETLRMRERKEIKGNKTEGHEVRSLKEVKVRSR